MKIVKMFVAMMILVILMSMIPYAIAEKDPEYYPLLTVVVEIDYTEDLVFCVDKNGEEWAFYGTSNWAVGDLVNLLMWNNGEDFHNHEILQVVYEGHVSDSEKILGWA